ncbi:hypothetical protein I308_100762 [Cryptococcus tetragattii IND107]|uniref:Uncharacterized protein n=1 Tax=Cryptococcus tetragattii IND107 TaxID=1296105 RepID=A0ABR3C873_9TREE
MFVTIVAIYRRPLLIEVSVQDKGATGFDFNKEKSFFRAKGGNHIPISRPEERLCPPEETIISKVSSLIEELTSRSAASTTLLIGISRVFAPL